MPPKPREQRVRRGGEAAALSLKNGVQEVWIGIVQDVERPIRSAEDLRRALLTLERRGEDAQQLFEALSANSAAEGTVEFGALVGWFLEQHGCASSWVDVQEQLAGDLEGAPAGGATAGGGAPEDVPPETSVWQWRGDIVNGSGRQDKWVAYPLEKSREIEHAFAEAMQAKKLDPKRYEAEDPRQVGVDGERYIDLKAMAQRRRDDPQGRLRVIRRRGILCRGWLEENCGDDTRQAGTHPSAAASAPLWRKRWAVLYGDGDLSCYAQPPKPGHVLPNCPPQSVAVLRLPSGECCRVEAATASGDSSGFTVVLPRGQDTEHRSKRFRLEDSAAFAEWQRVINGTFGPSAVLPRWEPGQEWIRGREDPDKSAFDLAERIIEVELRPGSNHWYRGTVIRFCDDGARALVSHPALAGLRAGVFSGVVKAVGATPHLIAFDTHGESETELERENNGKLRFRVATNPSVVTPVIDASGASRIDTIGVGPGFVGLRWRVQPEYSQASHQWEVHIRHHRSEWKPATEGGCTIQMQSPGGRDSVTASLFDLGSKRDQVCEDRQYPAEWRFVTETDRVRDTVPNASVDRQWECIIRGLPPSTLFEVRVRSFVCEVEQEGRGSGYDRTVYGAWSEIWSVETVAQCPPKHSLLMPGKSIAAGPADRQKWLTAERVKDLNVNMGELQSRWFRVRQPRDWDGMDVIWRCQPRNEREVWQVTVSAEKPSDLTAERGKREIKTWQGSTKELRLCGRVRAAAGEVVHVECKPPNGADSAMDYSYAAIRRKELKQRDPAHGRFLYIRHATNALSVIDITLLDETGAKIKASEAAMSSSRTEKSKDAGSQDKASPASNIIDGQITTQCTTQSLAATRREAWLRVDMGADHRVGQIEILTRPGQTLEGAVVSIATDCAGTRKTWESTAVPADSSSILTYSWLASGTEPEPEPEPELGLELELQPEPQPETPPKSEPMVAYTYPRADFRTLEEWLKLLAGVESLDPPESASLLYKGPSVWVDLEGNGVLMPFSSDGARAKSFRVKRQFTSKAMPYWVELAEGTGGSGSTLSLVMKYGDDLRQDQLALSMFALLNQVWRELGVVHNTVTGVRVNVEAPLYRVATCGFTHGFVEMLPDSVPVDAIPVDSRRGENGWKQSNRILPSSVAGFMVIYFLDVRDRHQGTRERLRLY